MKCALKQYTELWIVHILTGIYHFSTNAILDCCHITKFLIFLTTVLMVLVLIANGNASEGGRVANVRPCYCWRANIELENSASHSSCTLIGQFKII